MSSGQGIIVPRRLFSSNEEYFDYLLCNGQVLANCEPELHDAFVSHSTRYNSRQSSLVTDLSDLSTLPSKAGNLPRHLVERKAAEIEKDYQEYHTGRPGSGGDVFGSCRNTGPSQAAGTTATTRVPVPLAAATMPPIPDPQPPLPPAIDSVERRIWLVKTIGQDAEKFEQSSKALVTARKTMLSHQARMAEITARLFSMQAELGEIEREMDKAGSGSINGGDIDGETWPASASRVSVSPALAPAFQPGQQQGLETGPKLDRPHRKRGFRGGGKNATSKEDLPSLAP